MNHGYYSDEWYLLKLEFHKHSVYHVEVLLISHYLTDADSTW